MHVGFRIVGNVVVYHERDAVHVDTAGGHVGGDDDIELAHLEAVDGAFAHGLREVAVERGHVESAAFELLGDFGGALLGAHENQNAVKVFALQHAGERLDLVLVFHQQVALSDILDGRRLAFDAGFLVFAEVLVDNLLDFVRHRGAKERALGRGRDFFQDGFHVFHESHVEHLVGFVEHDGFHARKHDGAALDVVNEAARGGDHDVRLAFEGAQLHCDILPAVDGNYVHLRHLGGILLDSFRYLDGEFACRREHEHRGLMAVEVEPGKQRERESGCLAGTGLRRAEQVCSLQQCRDRLRLDGGGSLVVHRLDGFENFVGKSQVFEGYECFVARIFV